MADALLKIEGLTKRFGGVVASDNVRLDVTRGELHAIIGPNGAGKTTLIGQLAGEIVPDAGRIHFDGRDITALPVHGRSLLGLARSFQITSLFPHFTALDNVALAVQAHAGHSFRFWRDARDGSRAARAGPRRARARRPRSSREHHARQHEPRRAPAARDRHGAGHEAAHAAARRADGGHGPGRIGAHGQDAARAQARADDPPDRARHGGGVRAGRPHHRAGLWPRHRLRRLRPTIRANAEVRQAYLGEQEAVTHG